MKSWTNRCRLVPLVVCLVFSPIVANAQRWSRCASDLDQMRIAVNEANEAAKDARSAGRARYRAEQNYASCVQLPAVNDFRNQGCIEQVTAFQTTQMRYAAEYDIAREALDALAFAVQETELSCDFPMAAMVPVLGQEDPALSPACESFLRRRQGVSLDALRVVCTGELSEEECNACLGDPR